MSDKSYLNYRDVMNISNISHLTSIPHKKVIKTTSSVDSRLNNIKEIFSLINTLGLEQKTLNQNFIIIGDEGSGKSSLLEFLLHKEIFPKSLPSSNIPLKMTIESIDPYLIELPNELNEQNSFKELSIKINDLNPFDNLDEFHKYISDRGFSSLKTNEEYINLEVKLNMTSTDKQSKNFSSLQEIFTNFSIYEIETNNLNESNHLCNELTNIDNKIFLFCVNFLKYEKIKERIEKIKQFFKLEENENILIILTKPDKIKDTKDLIEIEKLRRELKLNLAYVKMRSGKERNNFSNLEFSVEEQKFYQSRNYLKKYLNCDQQGFTGVINLTMDLVIKNFKKNQNEIENFIKSNILKKFQELVKLGDEIPSDLKIKIERLKTLFKNILKLGKKVLEDYLEEIKYFLEKILHGIDIENNEKFESSYLTKELTKIYSTNFHKVFNESTILSNISKTKFGRKQEISTFKQLIYLINSKFIIPILDKKIEQLKNVFGFTVRQFNLEEITNEIERNLTNFKFELKNKFFITFDEMFEHQITEVFELIDKNNEMEKNLFYIKKDYYDELNKFYNDNLIKNKNDEKTEEFLKRFLTKICKDKLNMIIENNVKIFSFFFYHKLSEKLEDIPIDKVIENLTESDEELTILEEESSTIETRNMIKGELDILILLMEYLASIFSGNPLNKNLLYAYKNSSNNSFIDNLNKTLHISSDFNYQKDYNNRNISYYKNIMNKNNIEGFDDTEQELKSLLGTNVETDYFDKYRKNKLDSIRKPTSDSQQSSQQLTTWEREENEIKQNNQPCINDKPYFERYISEEFAMILDNSDEITVFNNTTRVIKKQKVTSIPYGKFLENNRYINICNSVYIAGGNKSDGEKMNSFYELIRPKNEINILPSLKEKLSRNSMIYVPEENSIVFVGGTESKCCYTFNITNKTWEDFGKLNIEREDPSLILMNNSTLLCFGGIKLRNEKMFENLIEYKKKYESDWKFIDLDYDRKNTGLLNLSGAGIIPFIEQRLIVVGGYNSENMKDEENVYEISITKDFPLHLKIVLSKEKKFQGGNEILSWFPENNFFSSQDGKTFSNFDLDGEIIVFNKDTEDFNLVS